MRAMSKKKSVKTETTELNELKKYPKELWGNIVEEHEQILAEIRKTIEAEDDGGQLHMVGTISTTSAIIKRLNEILDAKERYHEVYKATEQLIADAASAGDESEKCLDENKKLQHNLARYDSPDEYCNWPFVVKCLEALQHQATNLKNKRQT
jgi:hypothetical protein